MTKNDLNCGEATCAREPGKFCVMFRTQNFGTQGICNLFEKELSDQNGIPSGPGWLQRLPECIKMTNKGGNPLKVQLLQEIIQYGKECCTGNEMDNRSAIKAALTKIKKTLDSF